MTKQSALALELAKQHENIDTFKDDDWKKDWKKLPKLHAAVQKLVDHPKYGGFVKDWLKNDSRIGFRTLVKYCEPITYEVLLGIRDADSPEKVNNYSNLKPKHKLWM